MGFRVWGLGIRIQRKLPFWGFGVPLGLRALVGFGVFFFFFFGGGCVSDEKEALYGTDCNLQYLEIHGTC